MGLLCRLEHIKFCVPETNNLQFRSHSG
uniref:Uncharacterized protein n=1 Tax=Anguilla anguilla TaxID=7936 RepID=A0A0E9VK71_ANGAN